MPFDLTYNGTKLTWSGHGVFNATSGLTGHQSADEQAVRDAGPIPEGSYYFPLKLTADAQLLDKDGNLDSRDGIEHLPAFFNFNGQNYENRAWGADRVRLHTVHIDKRAARGRAGFYLHDSTKGFTHGCIEVDPRFFTELRAFEKKMHALKGRAPKRMTLQVKYPSSTAGTNGGTLVAPTTTP